MVSPRKITSDQRELCKSGFLAITPLYINSQKKETQGIPPLKKRNGSGIAQSEFEKAEEFNGQFSDVFTKSEYKQVPLMDRSAPFMHYIVVTKEGVTKLLKGLNPSKALGPDELHPES